VLQCVLMIARDRERRSGRGLGCPQYGFGRGGTGVLTVVAPEWDVGAQLI
jgi:hypothetical protein